MTSDIDLFVHDLLRQVKGATLEAMRGFKPDLSRSIGVVSPRSLPLADAYASTSTPGFLRAAPHGGTEQLTALQSDDPRVILPSKVVIDDADLDNSWINSTTTDDPPLSVVKDRLSVRMRGVLMHAAAATGTITMLADLYWPDERSFGFMLDVATSICFPIYIDTDGGLVYTDAGPTDLSAGALVFLDYMTVS